LHINKLHLEKYREKNIVIYNHEQEAAIEKEAAHFEIHGTKKKINSRERLITEEAGPDVYNYFSEHVKIDDESIVLTATTTPFNIENLDSENLAGIVNLKKVNDMRYINKFFEAVNEKLRDAGMYIGCVETSRQRYRRIESKFPPFIRQIVIMLDFVLNRIFPRISFFKSIYFNITSGVKRTISKAEVLGRLVSCGFEIIEYKEINNLTYFVVMKTGEPAYNQTPSYGPLFKMPRIGKDGKIIHVYKFRTMHPFSEYLQDYVLQLNGYSMIGKPADDFRLTKWGKFMRRLWLDEMPQIINILKGEMSIVGIRPLSRRAFEDYPDDVKKMRVKYKPGCIPPYVALLKQGMAESIEAERTYLLEKEKNPFFTDFKYFGMAVFNIISNRIRSA
jgi:lipopolysaccharide/colanic/teichoic acid biosynthesis glycosyltransferase